MRFDSIFFLSCFLPGLALLDLPLGRHERARRLLLLSAGLLFYAFSGLNGLFLLLCSALANYLLGLLFLLPHGKKAALSLAVGLNLAALLLFKYLSFFLNPLFPVAAAASARLEIAAPAGFSFLTFKAVSYLIDAFRDPEKVARNPLRLLLYLSFFPQVLAGPITRFCDFDRLPAPGRMIWADRAGGFRRFIRGLGKKLLLSGAAARVADTAFAAIGTSALNPRLAWAGVLAYSLQIFYDFSGYSDMSIGLGCMFGFPAPENFNYPFAADSVTEFWRRWHISLSAWFRDYLYVPLGGNRLGRLRTVWNKLAVFFLSGLWHGANWTFALWGLWHGLCCALESLRGPEQAHFRERIPGRLPGHIRCLLAVSLGFVLFRAETVGAAARYYAALLGLAPAAVPVSADLALARVLDPVTLSLLGLGILFCFPIFHSLSPLRRLKEKAAPLWGNLAHLLLLLLCFAELAGGNFAPFIYFQF